MKVALYVRVSTSEQAQEGYSISAQISLLQNYASVHGYNVYKIYQDAGISGKDIDHRPAMKGLLEDAKSKKFSSVLVWKLSRLSRSLLDLLSIVDTFNKYDISLQSHSEKFDTSSPMGKMLLQLLGSIAEFERNTIAENVKMGLGERFKQGYSKGAIPFGYKPEDKKAVIVPEQAEIVRHVFNTYLNTPDGKCLTYLAEKLNKDGFRTRTGGLWSRTAIRDMLLNHFYAGFVRTGIHAHGYYYGKNAEVLKGEHESIVSEEVFKAVNDKLKSKKFESIIRFPENDSILTGLPICPKCGARMFALNTHNKHKHVDGTIAMYPVRMYRCNNKDKGKSICTGFYISGTIIEPQLLRVLGCYINSDAITQAKNLVKFNTDKDNGTKYIEKELKDANKLKDKYFKLFETGKVKMELFADKINEILENINRLENELRLLESKAAIDVDPTAELGQIKDFMTIFEKLTNPERKQLLRAFIDKITITMDKNIEFVYLKSGKTLSYYH
jgi:site-specific DNA recombinase